MKPLITAQSARSDIEWRPAPIDRSWIRDGNPTTRNRLLSQNRIADVSTYAWDCTAGEFDWHYDLDETVYIVEGEVAVRDDLGRIFRLTVGDVAFFPAGCHAVWRVDDYVRKIAFLNRPPPKLFAYALRIVRRIGKLASGKRAVSTNSLSLST